VYGTLLAGGESVELPLAPGRHAWVHVARGQARVAGQTLAAGDAAAVSQEPAVKLEGLGDDGPAELLVFDLG
jgi:quercetin 2,3-dioxygenase